MNLEENTKFFRESFKGFNKDDVAAFIQKLSKDYADNEEKFKERIAKLTAENKAKTEEIEHLAAGSAAALSESEESMKQEAEQLSIRLNEKIAETEALNQSLKSSAADVDKYKDDVNKLLSEVRSKDAEIIELKKNAENPENSGGETENLKIKYTELLKINEDLKYKLEDSAKTAKESHGENVETVNELSAQIAGLSAELEEIKSEKDESLRNLDAVTAEKDVIIEDLNNQLEQNKARIEDEQKIYENITADLGSIIYSAKKSAEDIIAKAKNESEDIISRANIKKLAILEENERNIDQFKEKYNFIKSEHEKIIEGFKSLSANYSASLIDVKEAIENISKNI
jgi:chromosome segregation ATPase